MGLIKFLAISLLIYCLGSCISNRENSVNISEHDYISRYNYLTGYNVYLNDSVKMGYMLNDILNHVYPTYKVGVGTFFIDTTEIRFNKIPAEILYNSHNYVPIDVAGYDSTFTTGTMVLLPIDNLLNYLSGKNIVIEIKWRKFHTDILEDVYSHYNQITENEIALRDSLLEYAQEKGYLYAGKFGKSFADIATVRYLINDVSPEEKMKIFERK